MSFERYAQRFDRAVLVQDGQVTESDIRTRQGTSILRKTPRQVAPTAVSPVSLVGLARPGQMMTVLPGTYAGRPQPVTTLRLLRTGVADQALATASFMVAPGDLGRVLTVVETAANAAGQVETRASVTVAMLPPTTITASRAAVEIASDAAVPVTLATLSSDGDGPFVWTMEGAPEGVFLVIEETETRLEMAALPALGAYAISLSASNAEGEARTEFALEITAPAIEAPRQVTLETAAVSVAADAVLPRDLAALSVQGTGPFDWAVAGAGAFAEIDVTGTRPVLRLVAMPDPGPHLWTVTAANSTGMAAAEFVLTVQAAAPVIQAPTAVTLSAPGLSLATDATVPVTLALLSANGTAPVVWSHSGDASLFAIEDTGAGAALVLQRMPATGQHAVRVTATNAAGAAQAVFTLNVQQAAPVVQAPTAVTLSAASASLQADAGVPVALATLAANGTAPVSWSLVNGPAWAAIDTTGAQPVLRMTAMAPVGAHLLTVRAANGAGSATAAFALEIKAVPVADAPGAAITSSAGTITAQRSNPDGSMTFTLIEGGKSTDYTVSAATITAGHAAMLAPPVVTSTSTGNFTVTTPALIVAPASDPASLTYDWQVDGRTTGVMADGFAWRDPGDGVRKIDLVATVTNLAMRQAGADTQTRVPVQAATPMSYQTLRFNAPQNDMVTFTTPAQEQLFDRAVFYTRFRPRPDAGDTSLTGTIARLGSTSVEMTGNSALDMRALLRGTPSTQAYLDGKGFAAGDVIDVFVLYGLPFAITDARVSCKLRVLRNGVPLPDVNSLVDGANRLRIGPSEVWTLGGRTLSGANDGGITHEQFRVFYAPGAMAASLDEMQSRFLDAQGAMIHPDVARGRFGAPMLDFFNTTNSGTLGAPTTASVLA